GVPIQSERLVNVWNWQLSASDLQYAFTRQLVQKIILWVVGPAFRGDASRHQIGILIDTAGFFRQLFKTFQERRVPDGCGFASCFVCHHSMRSGSQAQVFLPFCSVIEPTIFEAFRLSCAPEFTSTCLPLYAALRLPDENSLIVMNPSARSLSAEQCQLLG